MITKKQVKGNSIFAFINQQYERTIYAAKNIPQNLKCNYKLNGGIGIFDSFYTEFTYYDTGIGCIIDSIPFILYLLPLFYH